MCVRARSIAQPHPTLYDPTWTIAHQTPLSMELSRQEHWSGLPFPMPNDLPDHPGIELAFLGLLHWQADYSWTPWEAQLGSEVIVKTIITTECSLMNCYEPESQFRTFICGLPLFNNFINKERGKYMEGIYLNDLWVAITKYIRIIVRQASALTCHKCKTHTQTKKRLNGLIQSKLSSIWQQQAQYDVEERKANVMLAAVVVSQTQALSVLLNFGQIIPQLGYGVPF